MANNIISISEETLRVLLEEYLNQNVFQREIKLEIIQDSSVIIQTNLNGEKYVKAIELDYKFVEHEVSETPFDRYYKNIKKRRYSYQLHDALESINIHEVSEIASELFSNGEGEALSQNITSFLDWMREWYPEEHIRIETGTVTGTIYFKENYFFEFPLFR